MTTGYSNPVVMSVEGRSQTEGAIHADTDSLANAVAAAGGNHVALIADGSVDEWHRAVESAGVGSPSTARLVSVDDTVRGGATAADAAEAGTAGHHIGGGIVLAAVEAPLEDPVDYLRSVLEDVVDEGSTAGGSVAVDDIGALLPEDAHAAAVVDDLVGVAGEFGVEFHAAVAGDADALSALARRLPSADDDADCALAEHLVACLRERDPTNFGYLRQNWREARRGLTAVGMTYPQSKQVHAAIGDPDTTPRTLGAALQALVKLGALGVWGDTVAANRYDLTGYDPARVDAIGETVEAIDD